MHLEFLPASVSNAVSPQERVTLIIFTVPSKIYQCWEDRRQNAEADRCGERETSEQIKANHQRILRNLVCSFLAEPVCVSAYQRMISYRKRQFPKTLGKQGSQAIFNVTQRTKTFQVFRVTDTSASNDAVSQQNPAVVQD